VQTCCEVDDRHGLASLTPLDISRIQAATHLSESRFVDYEVFDPIAQLEYEALRPANRATIRDGRRAHLRAVDARCVFSDPSHGCTLSTSVRPLLCRLYPFEVDSGGAVRLNPVGACLAADSPDGHPLDDLATSVPRIRQLHQRLLAELGDPESGRADDETR
jgi:Fe-S-cluster containining protein